MTRDLENRILLENYDLPVDFRQQIDAFDDHYTTGATTRACKT